MLTPFGRRRLEESRIYGDFFATKIQGTGAPLGFAARRLAANSSSNSRLTAGGGENCDGVEITVDDVPKISADV